MLRNYQLQTLSFVYEVAVNGGELGDNLISIPIPNGFVGMSWSLRELEGFASGGGTQMLAFTDGTDLLTAQVNPNVFDPINALTPANQSAGGILTAQVTGEAILNGKGLIIVRYYINTE